MPVRFAAALLLGLGLAVSTGQAADRPVRDVTWFLQRLRNVDHLPELEASHTALSSTWDRKGGNYYTADGRDFKRIENGRNILLDARGPGCLHRIFVGTLTPEQAETRIQIFLDGSETAVFDMPILEFFAERNGPFAPPLVFTKTYPGTFFPVPYAKRCRVQLVNPRFGTPQWKDRAWGYFWQIAYTTYPRQTPVESLRWPLSEAERAAVQETCRTWREAVSGPPPEAHWTDRKTFSLPPGKSDQVVMEGMAVIRQMRVAVEPATPEVLRGVRMQITWDGAPYPSVDVPLGYFFGHGDSGHSRQAVSRGVYVPGNPAGEDHYTSNFSSPLLGVTETEAYCCFPMPFAKGAVVRLENRGRVKVDKLRVRLAVAGLDLPGDWGRFHATWSEERAATEATPKFGPQNVPCKIVLDQRGAGKYVGALLHLDWPHDDWWGEGDWLIWSDEDRWPPSYHGTGTEEYFNSGWCQFDRKAVSGFVAERPGHPTLYSFHLNDAFQFQKSLRVAVEQQTYGPKIAQTHPIFGTTAYWYAPAARPAGSREDLLPRRSE